MNVTLYGAAGVVTGSAYLITTARARVLVDFGLFQGSALLERNNILPAGLHAEMLDAVLVTHAHLDHTGRLPLLARHGYEGAIFATEATVEMAELILLDAAKIQENDSEHENRRRRKAGLPPVAPLYTLAEAQQVLGQMRAAPYHQAVPVAPGVQARFVDSGHMLGSASIELTVEEKGQKKVVVFSGDLGPAGMAWLRDAETFQRADVVFLESTYGDRDHRPLDATLAEGRDIVLAASQRRGKIIVPAFAIGRTQQLLYYVAALFRNNEIDRFPIFVDSPMAIEATKVYIDHPELYDDEAIALARAGRFAQDLSSVKATPRRDQSIAINSFDKTCMVISASGMCTGGRIVHHLRHNLARPEASVILVGYQAKGTLGRELVDGAKSVRIFGDTIPVRADIHTLNGFSAHAGQTDLLRWLDVVAGAGPRVVLTHGEDRQRQALAEIIRRRYGLKVALPYLEDQIEL